MSPLMLLLYNLLFFPALFLMLPGYLIRIRKRGGYAHRLRQRFCIFDKATLGRIGTGRIWIHAVSVGEVGIALKFATEYRRLHPEAHFLVSSTTSTGLAIVNRSASDWLEPMASPVDFPVLTARLLSRLRPSALLFVEADLWPNRIAAAKRLGIPVALLNARLSRRSEKRFRLVQKVASQWFNQLDLITLSDETDRSRFLDLGVNPRLLHVVGNVKYDTPFQTPTAANKPTPALLLAASTHDGEETVMATAWRELLRDFPDLQLVIAPRHVERRGDIHKALRQLGFRTGLRSAGDQPSQIPLLLDTTGELASWYPRATLAFVGKSLTTSAHHGGQNMIEPLQAGTPVLIGPHTGNFEPLASLLCEAGAAIRVKDSKEIVAAVRSLIAEDKKRSSMIAAASRVLTPHQEATKRNCDLVANLRSSSLDIKT